MSDETKKTDITDSVTQANIKSIAEQPSMLNNLAYSNTIANQSLSQQNAVPPEAVTDAQNVAMMADLKAPQPPVQPQTPVAATPADVQAEMERLRRAVEKLTKK